MSDQTSREKLEERFAVFYNEIAASNGIAIIDDDTTRKMIIRYTLNAAKQVSNDLLSKAAYFKSISPATYFGFVEARKRITEAWKEFDKADADSRDFERAFKIVLEALTRPSDAEFIFADIDQHKMIDLTTKSFFTLKEFYSDRMSSIAV